MSKIIWMTDIHFEPEGPVTGLDPRARLRAAVDSVNAWHGDALGCVISGDLTDTGAPASYAALRVELDRLAIPYFPMAGNHDDRTALAEALPVPETRRLPGFVQYAVETGDAVLLCLDSVVPGAPGGTLCETRIGWLRDQLQARPDMPAYIFLHHPPVPLGMPPLDGMRLENGRDLMGLLSGFPMVRQVFAGHVHRTCLATSHGIPVTSLRAVLSQTPAPFPEWTWESYAPVPEAPALGVLQIDGADALLHEVQFCGAELGA
jgi:3',5'-cyclic AMP phosphodiesterase CpdA